MKLFQPQKPQAPSILEGKDIQSVAKYIVSKQCQNVFLMLGAGVSTSAGIPDFRSPETGLYANLAGLNLPYAEAVFEINFFRNNPVPFYTLAKELYPGKFRPTITHSFIRLLASHSLLHTCFTQNIDTLERLAGVPEEKIIEAHGSFASQRCLDCRSPYDDKKIREHVESGEIPTCEQCYGLVKPDIVFFGEELPPRFIRAIPTLAKADLLIVIGTSLTVHPFASLAQLVDSKCPRVLINLDRVGDFGRRENDVVLLGKCDDIVKDLCKELDWYEELIEVWEETRNDMKEKDTNDDVTTENLDEEKGLKQEVANLTNTLEKQLILEDVVTQIHRKQDDDSPAHSPLSPQPAKEVADASESKSHDDEPAKHIDPNKEPPAANANQSQHKETEGTNNKEHTRSQSEHDPEGKL